MIFIPFGIIGYWIRIFKRIRNPDPRNHKVVDPTNPNPDLKHWLNLLKPKKSTKSSENSSPKKRYMKEQNISNFILTWNAIIVVVFNENFPPQNWKRSSRFGPSSSITRHSIWNRSLHRSMIFRITNPLPNFFDEMEKKEKLNIKRQVFFYPFWYCSPKIQLFFLK